MSDFDETFGVDTDLALVPILMTKAFELTHRIGASEDRYGRPAPDLRAQRDVIVAEMERRSAAADRALATVEVAERTMMRVRANHFEPNPDDPMGAAEAAALLSAAADRMADTTCSLVKDQRVSDQISRKATETMRDLRARAAEEAR